MKKTFKQPELMVVHLDKSIGTQDIILASTPFDNSKGTLLAPDRFDPSDSWDAGY
ncbi:MAG: hypothetical protein IKN59_05115 [Paludibacteraceae bacterium]|nr:hypothetical protein [Paludibacteraceae bacterium]